MNILFVNFLVILKLLFSDFAHANEGPPTAFFYGSHPPGELLSGYERVVVEADNVTAGELKRLSERGAIVYAYFSIGEVGPDRNWNNEIEESWKLGQNGAWKSAVMDMTSTGWRDYLLKKRLPELWHRGYKGFFLDTMDSYQLYAKSEPEQKRQQEGMVELIKAIKTQFPGVHLLFNRGFEILERVASLADGVAAESLFQGWNPGQAKYRDVPEADRAWLMEKLKVVKNRYALPVTVLDYVPPERRDLAESTAQKIKALGFIPWVSTPALDYMGVGAKDYLP